MILKKDTHLETFFLICRISALISGYYHANKFFFPDKNNSTIHLLFVGTIAICVFGLWKRPYWFLYFFGALMLQQSYNCGKFLWQLWHANHIVDWKSVIVILSLPVIFIALIKEKKNASQAPANS